MPQPPHGPARRLKWPIRRGTRYGNTIPEYVLVGVGVLVVSIGALTLMGSNLDQIMGQLRDDMKQHSQLAATANAKQLQAKNGFMAAQASHTQTGGVPPVAGPPPPPAIGNITAQGPVTQTAGGMGTESYAQSITSNAQQALSAGTISQQEYDLIVRVANKGHDIASIQGLLESAYQKSNGNSGTYGNTMLNFNGQNYTPSQLNSILESNINDFSNLKVQASAQVGVLNDQKLLTILNDSGAQIINNGYSTQQQNQSSASYIQYQETVPGVGGSEDTHQQSATICTGGQHLDANNHCVP